MKAFSRADEGRRAPARRFALGIALAMVVLAPAGRVFAQTGGSGPSDGPQPIAIVPIEEANRQQAKVSGALQITNGTAYIIKNGTVTSGSQTTNVVLPRRGVLRVCASTAVTLSADTSVPAGETPGLMLAMDHGAIETSFAAGRNSDVLITPDLRILIGGPGSVDLKVRLGEKGDTCVDNPGANAPYVVVTSVFEDGAYRVQPGQRVMFQHGSLHEVVDQEKEPCGCPASARPGTNDFPQDQSAGLAPLQIGKAPEPPKVQPQPPASKTTPEVSQTLTYPHPQAAAQPAETSAAPTPNAEQAPVTPPAPAKAPKKKQGFFGRIGGFFKKVFGAE